MTDYCNSIYQYQIIIRKKLFNSINNKRAQVSLMFCMKRYIFYVKTSFFYIKWVYIHKSISI